MPLKARHHCAQDQEVGEQGNRHANYALESRPPVNRAFDRTLDSLLSEKAVDCTAFRLRLRDVEKACRVGHSMSGNPDAFATMLAK